MRFVAFFRAVNFGHAGSPTKTQFLSALSEVGATDAASLQSHGNAIFTADNLGQATAMANAACEVLWRRCGTRGPVFTRSLTYLAELVASDPFQVAPADDVYEHCVTFLPDHAQGVGELPLKSARRDVEVFLVRPGAAFSVTRLVGKSPGNVNGLLERLLGAQLTTRNWNTLVRLVDRHG